MELDLEALGRPQRYKLLTSLIVPRPIALVTSVGEDGVVNAAPFSYFNVFGEEPPIVVISLDARTDGAMKHTARNILTTREFVVNLVDEALAEQMHGCAVEAPDGVSELDLTGLAAAPSRCVRPPRIATAPVSLECKLHTDIDFKTRMLFIGQIAWMSVRDGVVDPANLRRVPGAYLPIGRLFANRYCRTRDEFTLDNGPYMEMLQKMGRV
jgi:flavin reductase (DIM6/NTAB) family NADH-FMN oxidoreductase RutF